MAKQSDKADSGVTNGSRQRPLCFLITPIGETGTDTRRGSEGLLRAVIRPVLEELGYRVEVAHEIAAPGNINDQVIRRIVDAELVVANLTDLNPNVMYELGIRHCINRPCIILKARDGVRLPFDVATERTLFYTDDFMGVEELRPDFKEMCVAAVESPEDSPVVRVTKDALFESKAPEGSLEKHILEEMRDLRNLISNKMSSSDHAAARSIGFLSEIPKDMVVRLKKMGAKIEANEFGYEIFGDLKYARQIDDLARQHGLDLMPF